jgi:hypothetical protein
MKTLVVVLAIAIAVSIAPISALAGHLDAITETTETMMATSGLETLVSGGMFGSGVLSTLQFTSYVDPQNHSFSYSLLPGQTYLGQSIALTTSGSFDVNLGEYTWATSGSYGGDVFSGGGSGVWANDAAYTPGDPEYDAETTITFKGKDYKGSGKVTIDGTHSTAKNFIFTDPAGKKWGPASGTDTFLDGKWKYDLHLDRNDAFPQGFDIKDAGVVPFPNGGAGNFQLVLAPTPEPASLLLIGSGVLTLSGFLRKRLLART